MWSKKCYLLSKILTSFRILFKDVVLKNIFQLLLILKIWSIKFDFISQASTGCCRPASSPWPSRPTTASETVSFGSFSLFIAKIYSIVVIFPESCVVLNKSRDNDDGYYFLASFYFSAVLREDATCATKFGKQTAFVGFK